jgi:3-deoxy-D-manno-octulosonate 8-phosphate phosphatase (KDO 8-P phosphatase)
MCDKYNIFKMNKNESVKLKSKLKKIKIVLTDVDGVLTDGGRYYTSSGEKFKKFHVRDGMGINLLLKNNVKTIIVTKEKSKIVHKWASDMNVSKIIMGSIYKEKELSKISEEFKVDASEIAFIGDDVNDMKLMKIVGLAIAPKDGNRNAQLIADYVCNEKGGKGAFREVADLILSEKIPKNKDWY